MLRFENPAHNTLYRQRGFKVNIFMDDAVSIMLFDPELHLNLCHFHYNGIDGDTIQR